MLFSPDMEGAVDLAWAKASHVPGYIGDREFRVLSMLFLGAPRTGATVEIGSFKGNRQ